MTQADDHRSLAPPDADTEAWWEATRRRELCVQRCRACGHAQHYPRALCVGCGSSHVELEPVCGEGIVDTFTVIHRAPSAAFDPPYVVALVRLAEGPTLLTNVVGCAPEDVRCDLPVVVDWRPLDDGRNLPVFAPG